jgi:hypothetical protein
VGAAGEEEFRGFDLVAVDGAAERGFLVAVAGFDAGAAVEQGGLGVSGLE